MDKRLLEQVQKALQAQEDTIQRQKQMLYDQEQWTQQQLRKKNRDIEDLTASLKKLAEAQTQQAERLPTLLEQLQHKISEQIKSQNGWIRHRKTFAETMRILTTESITLCNAQIQLLKRMKEYQSALVPEESLNASTGQLKGKLNDLRKVQIELEESQKKINSSQSGIEVELMELSKLLNKLEK